MLVSGFLRLDEDYNNDGVPLIPSGEVFRGFLVDVLNCLTYLFCYFTNYFYGDIQSTILLGD